MRTAVIGGGISGLAAAYVLSKAGVEVVLCEKENRLGGYAKTIAVDGLELDLHSLIFNPVTSPEVVEFLESLGVEMEACEMSFSVSLDKGKGYEWGNRNGVSSLFAQKMNVFNPYFLQMIREITKFKNDVFEYLEALENNLDLPRNQTLEQFLKSKGFSELFQKAYLLPMCASIWPSPSADGFMNFAAYSVLSFLRDHHLLEVFGHPQLLTARQRLQHIINKIREMLENRTCEVRLGFEVCSVLGTDEGCTLFCGDGSQETYDACIMAVNFPDALKILGDEAPYDVKRIRGAFQYVYSDVFLHRDMTLMPQNSSAWSAWNFLGSKNSKASLTYWLNVIQNIGNTSLPFFVTLGPEHTPKEILLKWSVSYSIPSVAASIGSNELDHVQGERGIWFCRARQGHCSHEDRLKSGITIANSVLGKTPSVLSHPRNMMPTPLEAGARLFVTRFLYHYVSTGCIILLEDGGNVFTFEGSDKRCTLRVTVRVHSPSFYWKIFTKADLGLADAYVNGDISVFDEDNGLLNLFLILIANRDLQDSNSKAHIGRDWWTRVLFTAKKFFLRFPRTSTLKKPQSKESSNDDQILQHLALFVDETMTVSYAIFETEGEDLKTAQQRKIFRLIEKAQIIGRHEVLDIGCGCASLGFEAVKQTGCKYTGINPSKGQLKYAEMKAKESGLEDRMRFLPHSWQQISTSHKYDRITAIEMIEFVGHENLEKFFAACEKVLAEEGLLVLQFTSTADELYDGIRQSSDFINSISNGAGFPSLSRVISASAAASKFQVMSVENIGIHSFRTIRRWSKNFKENKSNALLVGFNDKRIRTWEYNFMYYAAGLKSHIFRGYQVVFSLKSNAAAFRNPS